jgi:uncharacterized RDD family membrane protein YckC
MSGYKHNESIDYSIEEPNFVKASLAKRMGNLVMDTFVFFIILMALIIFSYAIDEVWTDNFLNLEYTWYFDRLISLVAFGFFIGVQEWVFKGKTIGKFITGTKVVSVYNKPLSFTTFLKRGLIRAIPFEYFSAFGNNPWHDDWTDTLVIDLAKTKATGMQL